MAQAHPKRGVHNQELVIRNSVSNVLSSRDGIMQSRKYHLSEQPLVESITCHECRGIAAGGCVEASERSGSTVLRIRVPCPHAVIPIQRGGTPLFSTSCPRSICLGLNHILAFPGAVSFNFPDRRMFISITTTLRKSLFSLGSRCRTDNVVTGDCSNASGERDTMKMGGDDAFAD